MTEQELQKLAVKFSHSRGYEASDKVDSVVSEAYRVGALKMLELVKEQTRHSLSAMLPLFPISGRAERIEQQINTLFQPFNDLLP